MIPTAVVTCAKPAMPEIIALMRRTMYIEPYSVLSVFENQNIRLLYPTPSPDGTKVAVTHWGDNTVGIIDITGDDITRWHYVGCYTVDAKLPLNYSRTVPVNRDMDSGYCLRGTLFTDEGRYLLVGCMGSGGGIAVIDLQDGTYLGRILGMKTNLRHLIASNGYLYASINNSGYVQRIPMARFREAIERLASEKQPTLRLDGWESCKVPASARTIVASPDGRFIFVACTYNRKIAVVDTRTMTLVGAVQADSFPVGLDISADGRILISTSQAKSVGGGNAVNIFRVDYQ